MSSWIALIVKELEYVQIVMMKVICHALLVTDLEIVRNVVATESVPLVMVLESVPNAMELETVVIVTGQVKSVVLIVMEMEASLVTNVMGMEKLIVAIAMDGAKWIVMTVTEADLVKIVTELVNFNSNLGDM